MAPSAVIIIVRKVKYLMGNDAKQIEKKSKGNISGAADRDPRLRDLSVGRVGFYSGCLSDIARKQMREIELDD